MPQKSFEVPTGTVFNLPEVITTLPEACSPDCTELDNVSDTLARPYLLAYFGDEDRTNRYLRQRISHFGCICYPKASPQDGRAQKINNLMIPVTLYDDTFSKPGIQESITAATDLHDRWVSVFNGQWSPPDLDPANPNSVTGADAAFALVHNAIEAAASLMPPSLAYRARKCWIDMAASHLDESVLRNNDVTPSLAEYMEKRLTNVYGWWLTTHAEYAAGIDIGEYLSEHPDILAVRRAAINHITLVNDLYSFPKELDAKEANMNAILVLMRREGLDLQSAVNKVVDLIHEAEGSFLKAKERILDGKGTLGPLDEETRVLLKAYLDALPYVMTGNLRWSQLSTRYFGDQHDGSLFKSGTVTITPKPTVHTSTSSIRVSVN